jgi:hypothetical protein
MPAQSQSFPARGSAGFAYWLIGSRPGELVVCESSSFLPNHVIATDASADFFGARWRFLIADGLVVIC